MTIELRTEDGIDTAATRDVIRALAATGDYSKLDDAQRGDVIRALCGALRLNPFAKPFEFIRLNGKLVLYATRGATDQLAAVHRLNRRIVRGPEIVDLLGKKTVLAVCEATLPNGRVEQSTATCDVADACGIHNVLMKTETKAKRRATLAILGLAILDEMEAADAGAQPESRRTAQPADEPEGSRAYARFVATIGLDLTVHAARQAYTELAEDLREEGEDPARYIDGDDGAFALAVAAIQRRVRVTDGEARICLVSDGGALAEHLDAAAEHAASLDAAARWWAATGASIPEVYRQTVGKALARTVAKAEPGDATATKRASAALRAAVAALTPPEPPTGTDAPSAREHGAAQGSAAEAAATEATSAWAPVTTSDGVTIDDEASARRHLAGLNVWALRSSYCKHSEPGWRALCVDAYAARASVTHSQAALTLAAEAARRATVARDERTATRVRKAA